MKASFEGNTISEELDMNFFFLNEDIKDIENNLDKQLSMAISMADRLKIKYHDIIENNEESKINIKEQKINDFFNKKDESGEKLNVEYEVDSEDNLKIALEKKIK